VPTKEIIKILLNQLDELPLINIKILKCTIVVRNRIIIVQFGNIHGSKSNNQKINFHEFAWELINLIFL